MNKSYYAGVLDDILTPINKELCSRCPIALKYNIETVKEAYDRNCIESLEAGCCSKCSLEEGYYAEKKEFKSMKNKYGFDSLYGFFDNAYKKCRIPREERNGTCLTWTCGFLNDKLKERYGNKICDFIVEMVVKLQNERR